ncbi:DUF4190 domain-containing protein [Candidatus Mycobacterium wuenschmannii]|uniref:DUF4190 domain-containing protein n=1 Tax=Candidatus Mycobacterium wuenschmannii TaxID=3027808 RepID=A0ABY8VYU5_9MYCO|nr:DUF4190 domain-containing protein [Candidatus Mycobacterium wuenschmannii]WIM88804.1 DUF4190 domain-containing protein [Candidatus Mycobacterium wuenschmannii]
MTGSPDQPVRRDSAAGAPHTGPLYPYPPQYAAPQPSAAKNGLGIAALVLAVVGLLSVATVFAPIALGAVAVVLGVMARGRVKRGVADNGGVAIAGIVLGGLAIVVGLAFIAIWTTVWNDVRGDDYIDCVQKAGENQVAEQHCADQFRRTVQDRLSVTLTPPSGS